MIQVTSADPRLLGALCKTVRSRKALEKQYLFRGSYKLSFFFFVFF